VSHFHIGGVWCHFTVNRALFLLLELNHSADEMLFSIEEPLADCSCSHHVFLHVARKFHCLLFFRNLLFLKDYDGDVSELNLDFTVVNNELGEIQVSRNLKTFSYLFII
jgi:hypothetical protein